MTRLMGLIYEESVSAKHLQELRNQIHRLQSEVSVRDAKINKLGRENSLMKNIIDTIQKTSKDEKVIRICKMTLNNVEVYEQL